MEYKINYQYLRPLKAAHLEEWYSRPFECRTGLKANLFPDAIILPLKKFDGDNLLFGRGGAVDENGEYIDDSAINARVQGAYQHNECDVKNEKVVYCGYLVKHWGHFLTEAVARLWYYLENDTTIDKYVFFIDENEEREIKGNYKEFFELLGVWDKIEIINKPTRYREVVVPELSYKGRTYYSQEYKDIFETIAANVKVESNWERSNKVFFTRSQLPKAREMEFGIKVLDSFYKNNGYTIVAPEKITLSKLIYLIRNAEICTSVSGTLPHNMLFARDHQRLVILERLTMNNDFQVDFNRMKSFDVTYIDSNLALYPVDFSGPSIIYYNGLLKKYAEDNQLQPPDNEYCKQKYYDKCFKKYFKAYRKKYGYQWFMMDWYIKYNHIGYIYEAYEDGANVFREYISGVRPVFFFQRFMWRYIKQYIKRLIK